jgi:predicted MFS family arabinose efflux permease
VVSEEVSAAQQLRSGKPASGWAAVMLSSSALALTLTGDQLLYVVLPLEAASFGVSLVWVGVLLSANRWIRVLMYGEVARLGSRVGSRNTTIAATIGAVVSTLMYAVCDGGPVLLGARVLWGLSFAALNLTTLVYAVGGGAAMGRMIGVNRSFRTLGQALGASLGGWLAITLGPREAFFAMTALTIIAVPMAWALPHREPIAAQPSPPARGWRNFMPSPFNLFSFGLTLAGEGVFTFTVGLLFQEDADTKTALLSAGIAVAARHMVVILVSPASGWIADRFGARPTMIVSSVFVILGFALSPLGATLAGVIVILLARGVMAVAGPILVAHRIKANTTGNVMHALSANASWSDLGAAAGPLLAGLTVGLVTLDALYAAMAVLLTLLLGVWLALERRAAT